MLPPCLTVLMLSLRQRPEHANTVYDRTLETMAARGKSPHFVFRRLGSARHRISDPSSADEPDPAGSGGRFHPIQEDPERAGKDDASQ
jgi:hypothetical protein